MPLYEYQCLDCGQLTEALQRVSDPPLTECPRCGGGLKKLLSAPAFQFKGSGWYVTDYARKGGSETGSAGGKGEKAEKGEKADKAEKADKGDKGGGDKPSSGDGGGKKSAAD